MSRKPPSAWRHYDQVEGPQPGTSDFVPTKEWLSQTLRVPVKDCVATEKAGGFGEGTSGARYFYCHVTYAGTALDPTFGLPTELFVKLRQPFQPINVFASEMVVGCLARHMTDPPPMARIFWAGPHSVISENLKDHFTTKEWKCCGEWKNKVSVKTATGVLKTFAHFHASFWKLPHIVGLRLAKEWICRFTGDECFGPQVREQAYDIFGAECSAVLKQMREEIGLERIFEHLSSRATTLCHGDIHNAEVLKIKKHSTYAQEHGRYVLIDFGDAVVANPAIDVGAYMCGVDVKSKEEWIQCLRSYWDELTRRLCAKDVDPGMTFEQFVEDVRIGWTWRMIFIFGYVLTEGWITSEEVLNKVKSNTSSEPALLDREAYDALVAEMKK